MFLEREWPLQAFVKVLGRDSPDAPIHDRIQRLLIAASLQPLCTVEETDEQHPLQALLELLLSLPTMETPSPAVRDSRIRFAAHFGLALVSLNAMPSNPGSHSLSLHCLLSCDGTRILYVVCCLLSATPSASNSLHMLRSIACR